MVQVLMGQLIENPSSHLRLNIVFKWAAGLKDGLSLLLQQLGDDERIINTGNGRQLRYALEVVPGLIVDSDTLRHQQNEGGEHPAVRRDVEGVYAGDTIAHSRSDSYPPKTRRVQTTIRLQT
ncbi:unnamed protein product [Clonostachys rosea]|uniref:Uncharacterized protein n=1 Tax=Bionectria ochroleuca TaxID=29856 RepID=A0ABY6UEQ7_BIOOC|nr:unnamed protein product [Clonostachys rosea]